MSQANASAAVVSDREISITRVFDSPRELVFKVWTDPKHIEQWWGPKGFVTTTFSMEVKPGGVWRFVMHGPDGRDYENKITYVEVEKPARLVYKHGGDKDTEPVNFQVTATFDEIAPKQTKLTMRMQFPSNAARDFVIKEYGADKGLTETIGRLGEKLAVTGTPDEEFSISRTFDAPRDRVFKAWTDRDQLMKWFGPKGFTMTQAKMDLRPGGSFHFCLHDSAGTEMWAKFAYQEILPPQRIVWIHSFSDAAGGLGRHPFAPEWPQQMRATATFAEHQGKTTVTVRWVPIHATELERKTFHNGRESMTMGWTGTFEQLAEFLAKGSQ